MHRSNTEIEGLQLLQLEPRNDERGWFMRCYCRRELAEYAETPLAQINHSSTTAPATLRGLHYQKAPCAETKMVRCIRGRVYDVAVDIRKGSRTFMHWYAVELSAENNRMLAIPEGFAHGFQTLEPDCELLYFHTEYYAPNSEASIAWNDPALNISWPLENPILSEKDANIAFLGKEFKGVEL